MYTQINLKYCLYIIIIIGFCCALPATAQSEQPPRHQETMRCGDENVSRYEVWVKDLPCAPAFANTDSSMQDMAIVESSQLSATKPSGIGDYTYLVYSSYRIGKWEIFGHTGPWDGDLDNPIRMTFDDAIDTRPRLRPGSTQIVFASNRSGNYELYSMDWGGDNVQQITWHDGYESQAAWSPDGSQLALVSELDDNLEIVVMQPDGSGWTRLTYDSADDFNPSWSPDGTKLVWVKIYDDYHGVIYTMNADGSNPQAITSPLLYVENPYWSRNGSQIAFNYDMDFDSFVDLVWMDSDGSNIKLVKGGDYMVDYLAGPWTGIPDSGLLFTQIKYVESQGELYISTMCIGAYSLSFHDGHCFNFSYRDIYPDASLQDLSVPETYILPLPKYVHGGDHIPLTTVGYDPGPAGIYYVEVERAYMGSDDWFQMEYWFYELPHTTIFRHLPITKTFIFRSHSRDSAGHVEPYPPNGFDTFTNVYDWQLFGEIKDVRDEALAKTSVVTSPVLFDQQEANLSGEFHRYVPDSEVVVHLDKTGYGKLPRIAIWNSDKEKLKVHDFWVMPPDDDLIVNGSFESDLSGWVISGDFSAQVSTLRHTGGYSVRLGTTFQTAKDANETDSNSDTMIGENDSPQMFSTSISQVVSIPLGMLKPTLSFLGLTYQYSESGNFIVQVNDTEVYSPSELPDSWEHVWIDLSEWQSQTVTVTFTVKNESYETPLMVNLDEISLGSWLTPIIEDVTPGYIDQWSSATITITGENFVDTPTVRLGETVFTDVVWVDEHTLQLELPSGIAPGIYGVWVINPGGQSGIWRGYLRVGDLQLLPLIQK